MCIIVFDAIDEGIIAFAFFFALFSGTVSWLFSGHCRVRNGTLPLGGKIEEPDIYTTLLLFLCEEDNSSYNIPISNKYLSMEQQNTTTKTDALELESTKPQLESFKTLFASSWQFVKTHFKPLFIFFFVLGFLPSLLQLIFQFTSQKLALGVGNSFAIAPVLFVFAIATFVVNVLSQVILFGSVKKVSDLASGTNDSFTVSCKKILSVGFSLIWASILTIATILGGTMLLIVPGILFAISLSFVGASVVLENKKGVEALVQSFWYVKGRRGPVFWRLFLVGLCVMLFSFLVFVVLASIAIGIISLKFGGFNEGLQAVVSFVLVNAGNEYVPPTGLFLLIVGVWSFVASLLNAVIWSIVAVFGFKLWENVKLLQGEVVEEVFAKKTKKTVKIVAWFGVIVVPIVLTLGVFASLNSAREKARQAATQNQMMFDEMQAELEKEMLNQ